MFFFLTVMSFLFSAQVKVQAGMTNRHIMESARAASSPVSACQYEGATADAQIAAAFRALGGVGAVDATCYRHDSITLAGPITLHEKQILTFSPDTDVRPASEMSTLVNMTPGAELDGLTVDLSTLPHFAGDIVHLQCISGSVEMTTTINHLVVHGASSAGGTVLRMYCDQKLAGLAFVTVSHLSSFGLAHPVVLSVTAQGAWINGNNFHDLHLIGPKDAPMTGISLANAGLEIRGNVFTGLQIEGNSVKGSIGIDLTNTGAQAIRANLFEGSMWDIGTSWHPPARGVMGNILIGNMDTPPVDNGDNTIYDLLDAHPGVEIQELTVARHLDQAGNGGFAGTCSMNGTLSCSFQLASPFAGTPICVATVQSSEAIAAGCKVDGTTVTIHAGSRNTNTWGAVLIGNPK